MDVTLLELHLPDAEFNAPFATRASPPTAEDAGERSSDDRVGAAGSDDRESAAGSDDREGAAGSSSTSRAGPVVALLALAGFALLARYLRGGASEQSTLDELEA